MLMKAGGMLMLAQRELPYLLFFRQAAKQKKAAN